MPDGAPAQVILAQFVDADGGHHARIGAVALEGILQRQRVHDGCEHADLIGGDTLHAAGGEAGAAENIASSDDQRHLNSNVRQLDEILGDGLQHTGADTVTLVAEQRFAAHLQQDTPVPGFHTAHSRLSARRMVPRSREEGLSCPAPVP